MAVDQHSTPAPERPSLPDFPALEAGRLLPPSLPCSLGPEAEFLLLMDLKRRTEARLDALLGLIDPGVPHLPLSGLRGVSPGVLLFKGGRHG